MRTIVKAMLAGIAVSLGLITTSVPGFAQAANGRGDCKPQVSVDYYQVAPGKHDEWLALYKKWHYPIMEYSIEHSAVVSEKIYASGTHMGEPKWDFAIIIVSPPAGQGKKLPLSRADLIRKLYPDLGAYVAGEKQRWSLTIGHWDEKFVELDPKEEPFSVYWPSDGGCKKAD